jgi:hypothetical protein
MLVLPIIFKRLPSAPNKVVLSLLFKGSTVKFNRLIKKEATNEIEAPVSINDRTKQRLIRMFR